MSPTITFDAVFLLFLIFSGFAALGYFYFTKKKEIPVEDTSYLEGLKYMAEGESRRAIEKFKQTVRLNSENVDAYLKLGIILRNEGLHNNAIRIHKDLTLRGNLPSDLALEVKRNLALDYWYAKNFDSALIYFRELLTHNSMKQWVIPFIVKTHEQKNEWKEAFELFEQSALAETPQGKAQLAIYKVLSGKSVAEHGEQKAARIIYKDALKIDDRCAAAYLEIGDSYWQENRTTDAIHAWTNLCKLIPSQAHLAFSRLERAWYEKGQFSKIEELYTNVLAENEDNIHALISLSEIYRKKGEFNEALKIVQNAHKKDHFNELISTQIVRILVDKAQFKEAAKQALELLDNSTFNIIQKFICPSCAHESNEPFWICQKCGKWNENMFTG